jgi:hypothetical protein
MPAAGRTSNVVLADATADPDFTSNVLFTPPADLTPMLENFFFVRQWHSGKIS